jgi:hypothetical protein
MLGGITETLLIGLPPLPAPPPVMNALQKIEIETAMDVASAFRLRLGITQTLPGDWDLLQVQYQETLFRPFTPVQIRLKLGIKIPEAIVNGYVTGVDALYDDEGGGSVLEVSGMDATMLMNLQEKVMLWPALPDSGIAAAIFGQYAVIPKVTETLPSLFEPEGTTTQRGTDIRFLRRLAQRNGFDCYVQPQPQSGLDIGYFGPATNFPFAPDAVLNVRMGPQTNVSEFRIRYDLSRPTAALGMGLDVKTSAPFVYPALLPASTPALAPPYPFGLPMGAENTVQRAFGPMSQPLVLPAETGQFAAPGLAAATQAIVNRSSWAITAEGTAGPDVGVLRPGQTANIRGLGVFFNGAYQITRVSHVIDCTSYVQKFQARRNAVVMTGAELYLQP